MPGNEGEIVSDLGDLAKQSSHYFTGRIVVMAAGFISFPVLTRIFTVADYGLLGLVNTTLFILVAVAKMGFPFSIVRFFAEYRKEEKLPVFYTTMFWGSVGIVLLASTFIGMFIWLAGSRAWDATTTRVASLLPLLVATICMSDVLTSFLRAEQKTKLYNVIGVMRRYGGLVLGITLAVLLAGSVYGFFLGHVISSIVFLTVLGIVFRKQIRIRGEFVSGIALVSALRFGFPLVWAELGDLVLNYADRYLVEMYLGREPLGLYTAGYNLATYTTAAVIQPINYAMTPIYMRILVDRGEEEAKEFFRRLLRGFVLVVAPLSCILVAGGRDLIMFLASSKYAEASSVLSYVVIGQALYAATLIINCGLFIGRKTQIITYLMLVVCAMNVGLNVLLIPRFGVLGAAQATLISYFFYGVSITFFSFREFPFRIDYGHITLYLGASFGCFLVLREIHLAGPLETLIVKGVVGLLLYVGMVALWDREVRKKSIEMWNMVRKKSGRK